MIRKQLGMTITELMIAVAIGLLVSAAVAGLFLQTSASSRQNDEVGYIQDNGKYALKLLADDLRMVNYWGGKPLGERLDIDINNDSGAAITNTDVDANINIAATGCGASQQAGATPPMSNWDYDLTNSVEYLFDADTLDPATVYPCITADSTTPLDERFILVVKRAKGAKIDDIATAIATPDGNPYIRTNRSTASLIQYKDTDTSTPPANFFDWQYLVHIYFIEDYKLKRWSLQANPVSPTGGAPVYVKEELAEGIDGFLIEWGIDNTTPNTDGVVDYYTSAPTAAELRQAVTARIHVLARSSKEILGYTNDKSYNIGGNTFTMNDGYYRRIFSTTVVMKNTEAALEL